MVERPRELWRTPKRGGRSPVMSCHSVTFVNLVNLVLSLPPLVSLSLTDCASMVFWCLVIRYLTWCSDTSPDRKRKSTGIFPDRPPEPGNIPAIPHTASQLPVDRGGKKRPKTTLLSRPLTLREGCAGGLVVCGREKTTSEATGQASGSKARRKCKTQAAEAWRAVCAALLVCCAM